MARNEGLATVVLDKMAAHLKANDPHFRMFVEGEGSRVREVHGSI